LILLVVHGFWSDIFVVDYITILLIVIIAIPFLAQYLKKVRFGEAEFEFRDEIHGWYNSSKRQLEEKKQLAIESKEVELVPRLEEEIAKRGKLKDKYDFQIAEGSALRMRAEEIEVCGTYTVVGRNPYAAETNYFGELDVRKSGEVYAVTWSIAGGTQHLSGIGLLHGTTFSVAFKQTSRLNQEFRGVVVYEIITPEIMRGHWAGFGSAALGFEECRKK
ncbi:unnamed protein product, partial [marine sediment metagenome]